MTNNKPLIRLGIVGVGFGRHVHLPAFRLDPRCEVVALAASRADRALEAARETGVPQSHGDWRSLVEDNSIDAVSIAAPPDVQSQVAMEAIRRGKAVFAEKPLALTLAIAEALHESAIAAGVANMVDFNFPGIAAWREAKRILDSGGVGRLRHLSVNWNIETYANAKRRLGWKALSEQGGGTLFNFVSHVLYNLEWLAGPIVGLQARLFRAPGDERITDTFDVLALEFESGAAASVSVSAAAFLGSGHRIDVYGDDGTLVLSNESRDYAKGFHIFHGTRDSGEIRQVPVDSSAEDGHVDGRIAAVGCLARSFLDWIKTGVESRPSFRDGSRVQRLLEAARQSQTSGQWIDVGQSIER